MSLSHLELFILVKTFPNLEQCFERDPIEINNPIKSPI
jgi:hypothetical protein